MVNRSECDKTTRQKENVTPVFIMNALRKFFANLQKHGAITGRCHSRVRSLTDKASVLANEAKSILEKPTDVDPLTMNKDLDSLQQTNKGTTESCLDDSVKVDSKESIKNIDADLYPMYDTTKCLKEFDKILEEINRDFVEEYVSLDEIDDVLNCMTEKENVKEPLKPEIPRFDSQELQNEDIEPIYLDDIYLCESDIENPFDLNEIDKPDIVKTNEANLRTNSKISNIDYYIEINTNVQNADVISISSEDSQAYDTNLNPEENKTNKANLEINNETSSKNYYIEINNNVQSADIISISSEDSQTYETNLNTEENKRIHTPEDDNEPEHVNEESKVTDEPRNVDRIEESDVKSQNLEVTDVLDDCEEIIKDTIVELIKDELKNIKSKSEETDKSIDVFIDDSNNSKLKNGSGENVNDELKNMNKDDIMVSINVKSEDTENVIDEVFIDDSNCELKYVSGENVNDEPKNVNNRDIVDSDDDCGYQSTDFEFITEDEAKMDGLIVNFDLNTLKRKVSKLKRVKTLLDSSPLTIGSEPNLSSYEAKQIDDAVPSLRNIRKRENTSMQVNRARNVGSRLRNAGRHRGLNLQKYTESHCRIKDINSIQNKGPKHLQRDDLVHKNGFVSVNDIRQEPTIPGNCTEASHLLNNVSDNVVPIKRNTLKLGAGNIQGENETNALKRIIGIQRVGRPSLSQENGLGFNNVGRDPSNLQEYEPVLRNMGHGPSRMQQDRPGLNGLRRNYPETLDHKTERWRAFQYRNRNMLVIGHNNEHHRILSGEEYYRLFNPNFGPLPDRRLMELPDRRLMENKSTLSTSMFVDYNGVGFDFQMMRERNDSEEDGVKEEADESARKILNMYPGENRKRRRFQTNLI